MHFWNGGFHLTWMTLGWIVVIAFLVGLTWVFLNNLARSGNRGNRAGNVGRGTTSLSSPVPAEEEPLDYAPYGYVKNLTGVDFETAVENVVAALKAEGFGILSDIDVQQTLKKKLDVDFRKYTILGACNPALAHRALRREPQIGLLLPCNVVLQEYPDGEIELSIADPRALFRVAGNLELEDVVKEAEERLTRVFDGL